VINPVWAKLPLFGSKGRAGNGLISQVRWLLADGLIKLENRRGLLRLEVPSHSEGAWYRVKECSIVTATAE